MNKLQALRASGDFETIQKTATGASRDLEQLAFEVNANLEDAGMGELAADIKKAAELLDKIRRAAFAQR